MIKLIQNYFKKPNTKLTQFIKTWNQLRLLYDFLQAKSSDYDISLNSKAQEVISLFGIDVSKRVVEKLVEGENAIVNWDLTDCLDHALRNNYFEILVAYAKTVTSLCHT